MPAQGNTRLGVTLVGSDDQQQTPIELCTSPIAVRVMEGTVGSSLVSSTYVRLRS
jgi:hypothetical protein